MKTELRRSETIYAAPTELELEDGPLLQRFRPLGLGADILECRTQLIENLRYTDSQFVFAKLSANATAVSIAFDLFTVSWYSASGVESLTHPPPAWT